MVDRSVELGFEMAQGAPMVGEKGAPLVGEMVAEDFENPPELPAKTEQPEDKPQSRDPSPEPDADAAEAPVNCEPLRAFELCEARADECDVVFEDGTGCAEVCASAGLVCRAVFEDVAGECAPDLSRPELSCEPSTGHTSDFCRCGRDATCVPDCAGRECGADGCGGSCGGCGAGRRASSLPSWWRLGRFAGT